jgi:hypothetical protein
MGRYCANCGFDLSSLKIQKKEEESLLPEIEEIIIKKPKKIIKKVIEESQSDPEDDPKEVILKKVAERLVMKKNGEIDIKNKVTEKQKLALQKMREGKLKKKQEQGEDYKYPKVEVRKLERAKAIVEKAAATAAAPKKEEPKEEPPKNNNNNNFYNIF